METKRVFKWFTVFEYEKEQEFLRQMHRDGWKFLQLKGLGVYHFEKCDPEDVIYQLDYNAEGLANKEEYLQMFRDCGWEYLQDYVGYSYFRKPAAEGSVDESIFCDEESRMQMMERVIKGRMLPLLVVFFALLFPQFILNLCVYHNTALAVSYSIILVIYVLIFADGIRKYSAYKNNTRK